MTMDRRTGSSKPQNFASASDLERDSPGQVAVVLTFRKVLFGLCKVAFTVVERNGVPLFSFFLPIRIEVTVERLVYPGCRRMFLVVRWWYWLAGWAVKTGRCVDMKPCIQSLASVL